MHAGFFAFGLAVVTDHFGQVDIARCLLLFNRLLFLCGQALQFLDDAVIQIADIDGFRRDLTKGCLLYTSPSPRD